MIAAHLWHSHIINKWRLAYNRLLGYVFFIECLQSFSINRKWNNFSRKYAFQSLVNAHSAVLHAVSTALSIDLKNPISVQLFLFLRFFRRNSTSGCRHISNKTCICTTRQNLKRNVTGACDGAHVSTTRSW